MTEEGRIKKEIIEYLRLLGWLIFRLNSGQVRHNILMCPAGTPDLFCVGPHRRLWIEVKTLEGVIREDQSAMHTQLENYGEEVLIARSVEEVIAVCGVEDV